MLSGIKKMCISLDEVKLSWCGEIMFGKICYFLFWRGPVDEEQKMDYLTARSVDCLGGCCLGDIMIWHDSQPWVLSDIRDGLFHSHEC